MFIKWTHTLNSISKSIRITPRNRFEDITRKFKEFSSFSPQNQLQIFQSNHFQIGSKPSQVSVQASQQHYNQTPVPNL
ncbi:hypothetical protein A4A49_28114 [Nicotiana attenuata]|uniref:Uncharacterized protein n=1 Tax=Nicotiana attenuata TaxID=49451 RepID=A0A1J6K8W4_NICAT|nr:hypothetical protein A4A49_28114 [Nicotiana attenuata]